MSRFLKIMLVVSACAMMIAGSFSPALAGDVLSSIKSKGEMVVGTSADYPPYESKDKNDNFVGFDMDLIREVGKRMGVKVKIVDMGFDTLIAALQKKKVDLVIAAMQATPERDKKIDFSNVYHEIKDAFLVKAGSGIKMAKAMDAAGKKIAVQTGSIQEKWVKKNLVEPGKTKKEDVFSYERVDAAAMDVGAGRVDILFIVSDPAKAHAKKSKLEIALITTETVAGGQSIAMPEGEKALKAEIDKVLGEMKKDGSLAKLIAAHGLF